MTAPATPPAAPAKKGGCLRNAAIAGGGILVLLCILAAIGSRLPATPKTPTPTRAVQAAVAPTEVDLPTVQPTATEIPLPTATTAATAGPTSTPEPTRTPRPVRRTMTKQELGKAWPFTVESVELWCSPRREVIFKADGITYALNGTAKAAAAANGWEKDLGPIWLDDPSVPGLKVNLTPILDAGLELCQ